MFPATILKRPWRLPALRPLVSGPQTCFPCLARNPTETQTETSATKTEKPSDVGFRDDAASYSQQNAYSQLLSATRTASPCVAVRTSQSQRPTPACQPQRVSPYVTHPIY